jgi:putative two-component system response regulator
MKGNPNLVAIDIEQVKKYAQDFSKIYRSEKEKRSKLQAANAQLVKYAGDLGKAIRELKDAHRDLEEAYLDTIQRLVLAAEYRDHHTGDHIVRMSRYSALIAQKLGLPDREVQTIFFAAPMHDVGKIGIPDSILQKTTKLTEEEFVIMTSHTKIGAKILARSRSQILQVAQQIAISHHERWDGKGYPQGRRGNKIPLAGRIVGLADVFDALNSKRPYKDPYPFEVSLDIMRRERGKLFDPDILDVFMKNIDEVLKIREEISPGDEVSLADFSWSERDREN